MAAYATYPSLADRGVFITGGAAGIGSAMVEQFAVQGSKVFFVDKDVELANATVERCAGVGVAHVPVFREVDLLDIPALQRSCATAVAELGGIDVLVNNAANDDRHDWRDVTPEYFDDRINTNLRHYFFAIQALAPQMIEAGRGSIVNIGSSSYLMQEDMFPGYAIANLGPSAAYLLGDTPSDIEAARSNGMVSVAVCNGQYNRVTLEAENPDIVVDSFEDAEHLFEALDV